MRPQDCRVFLIGLSSPDVGDTADKFLFLQVDKLKDLHFFELNHGELPDIVAYSASKNCLYLIEAVHSFGPIPEHRLLQLKKLYNLAFSGG